MNLILILTSFIFISHKAIAANHMIIMGGSGDPNCIDGASEIRNQRPNCEKTIFDPSLRALGTSLKNVNWNYSIAFNGGHTQTEEQLKRDFGQNKTSVPEFNEESFLKIIAHYKAKILSGEITSKDQIVLVMNSHGAINNGKEKTHQIAAGRGEAKDLKNLKGSTNISLDLLEELVGLTNKKGIKLGIIDLSCHSGSTLALKKNAPHTCIITATSSQHYAWAGESTFGTKFMQNIIPGNSLESAFLNARSSAYGSDYPMISTVESAQIVDEVYQTIMPFLFFSTSKNDKLSEYIHNNSSRLNQCVQEMQFQKLIAQILKLEEIAKHSSRSKDEMREMRALLTQYHNLQKSLKKRFQEFGDMTGDIGFNFTTQYGYKFKGKTEISQKSLNVSVQNMLTTNFDKLIAEFQDKLKKEPFELKKAVIFADLENFKKAKTKQAEMLSPNSKYKNFVEEAQIIKTELANTKSLSEAIALKEKMLFDELYKQKQTLNMEDPCKRITF